MEVEQRNNLELTNEENNAKILNTIDTVNSTNEITELQYNHKEFCTNDSQLDNDDSKNTHENCFKSYSKIRRGNVIDSDSDDEGVDLNTTVNQETSNQLKTKPKRPLIFDSESEDEVNNKDKSNENINPIIYNTNDKGELVIENGGENIYQKSRLSALCDPESSDEDGRRSSVDENHDDNSDPQPQKYKKRNLKHIDGGQKMTGKQAAEQRKEIQSESQRMTRELQVSLPYHKPKTRTLKEFLQKRPRFEASLPKISIVPPSVALKMSTKQLEIVSTNLEGREKTVEEFFKSDSESELDNEEENDDNHLKEYTSKEKNLNTSDTQVIHQDGESENELFIKGADENCDKNNTKSTTEECLKFDSGIDDPQSIGEITTEVMDNSVSERQIVSETLEQIEMNKNKDSTMECVLNLNNDDFVDEIQISHTKDQIDKLMEKYKNTATKNHIITNQCIIDVSQKEDQSVISEDPKGKVNVLKEKLRKSVPKLSGGPDEVIDLDSGVVQPNAISQLMERFIQHTTRKSSNQNKKIDIVSVSDGEIRKETIAISVDEEAPVVIMEKPGAKLQKLRDELQQQMLQQRSEIWLQRSALNAKCEDTNEEKAYVDDDILDDEEEAELTDLETEDEEIDEVERPKNKSTFLDDEAEVSEEDDELDENFKNQFKDDVEEDDNIDENTASETDNDADDDEIQENTTLGKHKKKKMRRILQPFSNDSDEECSVDFSNHNKHDMEKKDALDSTDTWDEYGVPTPHQRRTSHTPNRQVTQSKSELGFLTPVTHLTGLQSLNSGSKFLHESPVSPFVMPPESSPLRDSFTQHKSQKKLFTDTDITSTQEIDELAEICSGQFDTQITSSENNLDADIMSNKEPPEICSKLTIATENATSTSNDKQDLFSKKVHADIQSQCNNDIITDKSNNDLPQDMNVEKIISTCTEIHLNSQKEIKDLDDTNEDKLISQLLDEEELVKFKKKFDSPIVQNAKFDVPQSSSKQGRFIFDSDDEDQIQSKLTQKRKQKKLVFSDDDEDSIDENDEEIDLHDCDDAEETNLNVEYDSEENEIEVDDTGDVKKKFKVTDFMENEAELSESEWGSADEDEKDLDEMEFELGDTDKFDQNQVKRDLERIHMRQVLDDDNHEVKILQELLLDDGELHGAGRQRQFRWKNIESMGNDNDETLKGEDGDTYLDDENESEETWRKMRYEREIFLKKKQESSQKQDDDDDLTLNNDSQVFKLGQAALKRSVSNSQNNTPTEKTVNQPVTSPDIKQPISLLNKRGSFLSRSDQVLARVAEFTKITSTTIGGAKNSKNFVFQSVSVETQGIDKKRKAADGTPNAIKKLRLDHLSPAVQKKVNKKQRVKNLFSNW